ncbi:MAG: 16S rRNA (guanine(527)-N(7))-methyltransferase RsmG, partial [Saprospiraceae bacterium]
MESLTSHFKELDSIQKDRFSQLKSLYEYWNTQINVISRKDMEQFYLHHVLHSLTLTKFLNFANGTKIMDLGCGGGFPGIPLAIFFPEVEFVLIDSIGKKIKVVREVVEALNLKNVRAYHIRSEDHVETFQFVVTRAVAKLKELIYYTKNSFESKEMNSIPNGLIAYKGGDIHEEIAQLN